MGVSEKSALDDDTLPQGKAFQWICNDPFSSPLVGNDNDRIIQRYALAVFYYSTNGDNWKINSGWLSDSDECTTFWKGINFCTDGHVGKSFYFYCTLLDFFGGSLSLF